MPDSPENQLKALTDELYNRLSEHEYLRRFADALISYARPAVKIEFSDFIYDVDEIGISRYGGQPDLPQNIDYPHLANNPMFFIAQIRLEEVSPADLAGLLPKQGLLSFFIPHFRGQLQGKVYYYEDTINLIKFAPPPSIGKLNSYRITSFIPYISLPEVDSKITYKIFGVTPEMSFQEKYEKVREYGNWLINRPRWQERFEPGLLGYPKSEYGMTLEQAITGLDYEQVDKLAVIDTRDYMRLFQIHIFGFGDRNPTKWRADDWAFYYCIHQNDLLNCDFDKAIFVTEAGE